MSAAVQLDAFVASAPAPLVHCTHVRAHLRTVKGTTPQASHREPSSDAVTLALEYVRGKLAELYRSRAATHHEPWVSADDADLIIREWAECPRDLYTRKSQAWRGHIFRGRSWERTGKRVISSRDAMHAHDYPTWRYVGYAR